VLVEAEIDTGNDVVLIGGLQDGRWKSVWTAGVEHAADSGLLIALVAGPP
jgi:hypothetical protein